MDATTVVVGPTGSPDFCPMSAMWRYLSQRQSTDSTAPLFTDEGKMTKMVTYAQLRRIMDVALADAGLNKQERAAYGAHSFRIGAAQALALAGRSLEYTMAMGRWRCMESVLTYVETPTLMRITDIRDMMRASHDGAQARAMERSLFHATHVERAAAPL